MGSELGCPIIDVAVDTCETLFNLLNFQFSNYHLGVENYCTDTRGRNQNRLKALEFSSKATHGGLALIFNMDY